MIVGKLINPDLIDMATVKINHLFSSKIVFSLLNSLEPLSKKKKKLCLDFQKCVIIIRPKLSP